MGPVGCETNLTQILVPSIIILMLMVFLFIWIWQIFLRKKI